MERVRNANGTRSERVPDAFRTQMERERSVRLFLSSTVCDQSLVTQRLVQLKYGMVNFFILTQCDAYFDKFEAH